MYLLKLKYFLIYLIFGFIGISKCQIIVFDVNFENALVAQQGLGWPASIHIAKGNEALMKLNMALENYDTCTVVSPSGIKFDVSSPPSSRYDKWGDFCGIRVRNVSFQDVGRWRLTTTKDSQSRTGWVEVHVLEDKSSHTPPPLSLMDGQTETTVNLSPTDNAYCVVAKPFSESSLVPGHCSVTLDRTTRAVQGNWQINLGLPGRVAELQTKVHVTVETERLDVGYIYDAANKLHLYCNILHTTKNISFCRFQRTSSSFGYNVIDGLSDGKHSYYGEGFALKQCGMTIERPTVEDYGSWRCSVGVKMFVGTEIQQQPTMQALISVPENPYSVIRSEQTPENTLNTIFVQENSQFTITCNAKISLSYCWFQHPNGTQFTPVPLAGKEQIFWYAGENLDVGDCSITFKHAINTDGGQWTCHMGPKNTLGVELTDKVNVRVTGSLAANEKEIGVNMGSNATLYCHTANGRRPLKYCRFLSPTFTGMNIDSSINKNNAILDRYYFTPERDINFGDCSLNIISVQEEDIGDWTCAAVVDNEILESRDSIKVYLSGTHLPQFHAGIIGMSVGLSVLVVVLIGYVLYKRAWLQRIYAKTTRDTSGLEEFSLDTRSNSSSESGSGEGNSGILYSRSEPCKALSLSHNCTQTDKDRKMSSSAQ